MIAENVSVVDGKIVCTDAAVTGTTYTVTVTSDNYADLSAEAVADLPTPPEAPEASVELNAKGNPVITWNAVEGAVRYQVYRDMGDGTWKLILTTANLKCTHNKNVTNATTYSYKVCAIDANGSVSAFSSVVKVKTGLPAPKASVKLNANGKPVITWKAVEGAASYKVYCAAGDGVYKRILATPNLKCTHVKNVESGTTYSYKVCAVDADGVVGVCSTVVTVTIP